MPKLIYTPKALENLQGIKAYVAKQFGGVKAKACVKEITSTAILNEKQDSFQILFGISSISKEGEDYWGN